MGVYNVKQYIIARKDLNMPSGKLAAQAAHASVGALLKATENVASGKLINYDKFPDVKAWLEGDFAKVCLAVNSEEELERCYAIALENNIPCAYIIDNGTTVFNGVHTPTCVGIGPAKKEVIEPLFANLKLYK